MGSQFTFGSRQQLSTRALPSHSRLLRRRRSVRRVFPYRFLLFRVVVTFFRRLAAAFPAASLASKWEIHWAVQNNIGGGIQLLLPPLPPLFLANLSISICARCSDGAFYNVRYSAAEATGGRHAWDSVLRRIDPHDDAFHDLGCGNYAFVTLRSRAHSVPAAVEFAPRASREIQRARSQ